MTSHPPFHEGELDAQRRAHEEIMAARNGKVIKQSIVEGALSFIRQQPMVIAGTESAAGDLWASMLFGKPGFLDPSPDRLVIHLDQTRLHPNDPLLTNLEERPEIGLLLIELSTRRRLRVNGPAQRVGDTLTVEVGESYPICPKYIQKREIQMSSGELGQIRRGTRLGHTLEEQQIERIRSADTFFVASSHATHGPDVSHRGGKPGFVKVSADGVLRIPDYRGNSMLSTLGNFTLNPNAGLAFPDFKAGTLLQITGKASLFWDQPDPAGETGGSNRFWEFHPEHWQESSIPEGIQERFLEYSPFNP